MGMYTELFISTRLRVMPTADVAALQLMINSEEQEQLTQYLEKIKLPDHQLFRTTRWRSMLSCSSYYFTPHSVSKLEWNEIGGCWSLTSRSDFKNYDDEAELFFDWIRPYLYDKDRRMIGYTRYEEDIYPTLYFADGYKLNGYNRSGPLCREDTAEGP
jgi:hypothetical protein